MANRLTYIDILKGFTILWVVWMHMNLPSFLHASVQMPVFFFISGCFFKPRPFNEFIKKKFNTLIVPFVFFWFINYLYYVVKNEFIPVNFNLNEVNLYNVINIWDKYSYLRISILWFLIVLFTTEVIWFFVKKYKLEKIFILVSILFYIIGSYLYATKLFSNLIFPIAELLVFQIYYAVGITIGRKILNIVEGDIKIKQNLLILIGCLITLLLIQIFPPKPIPYLIYIFPYTVAFIILALKISYIVRNLKIMDILNFYGKNSIVVYTTHFQLIKWVILPSYITTQMHFWIICVVEILLILFFNKFMPTIIGKKPLIK